MHSLLRNKYQNILLKGDIKINGSRTWDIQLHNEKLWNRVLFRGSLGLGEAYMHGWYDVEDLSEFFYRLTRFVLPSYQDGGFRQISTKLATVLFNVQNIKNSFKVGRRHYDIGNDLYQSMLGSSMAYTCGYWKGVDSLDAAQIRKFRLIGEKLKLKPGMRVLDIGCGFGSAMAFFSKEYGVEVLGVTVSKKQAQYIRKYYQNLPIRVKVQDYRLTEGKFDRIYSIGMFEHVGYKNYKTYMQTCWRLLTNDGLALLHTIGNNISVKHTNAWVEKYIFPNSMLPSLSQIACSAESVFIIEDVQNFGYDYYQTLLAWDKNFTANWSHLSANYSDIFYRMWRYYLLSCAGAFKARDMQLFQIVMSVNGVEGRYDSPR